MTQLLKTRVLAHDRPAPRYTSYPTAPQFGTAPGFDTRAAWLECLTLGQTLSLYLHIPFCSQLCYYCGCHTSVANSPQRVADYVGLLLREVDLVAALADRHLPVSSIHFGGGSPTMLEASQFAAIMDRIGTVFEIQAGAEIAIEADPRHLSQEKIETYARHGLTRLSLGVQDFDQDVLAAINRPQPFELSSNAVAWGRAAGIASINFDLMYGLPLQTMVSQRETLARAVDLRPDRIAYFGYAHVPWMKKHMDLLGADSLPDASLRYDLFASGSAQLQAAGYVPVGIDHFALPADSMVAALHTRRLHRNFQGYTTDRAAALLGFGLSAISSSPMGYVQNTLDHRAYAASVEAGTLPAARGFVCSAEDRLRGEIIEQLMCYFEVSPATVLAKHDFPEDYLDKEIRSLQPLVADGLVSLEAGVIRVRPEAPQIVRLVAMAFDAYAQPAAAVQRHARAV